MSGTSRIYLRKTGSHFCADYHPSYYQGVHTGMGIGTLDTYTMKFIVFLELFTLIHKTLFLSSGLIGPPGLY